MEMIKGVTATEALSRKEILSGDYDGRNVLIKGMVHAVRDMGEVSFVVLRNRDGLMQCVYEGKTAENEWKNLKEETAVEAEGILRREERAPGGVELRLNALRVLSRPAAGLPLHISKWKLNTSLEAKLDYRSVSLRNVKERAKFKLQEGIVRSFRDFLYAQGFTEIHTPKIGAKGAEGGSNLFRLDYFHRPAVLAQSPQFYKQMMVGVFDRVFETAPVFRAEKHSTKRHLNEYTSLDLEMGFIEGMSDLMEMEAGFLQYMGNLLRREYRKECDQLGVKLPRMDEMIAVRFEDAKRMASERYGRAMKNPYDLEPEEEQLIGRYFQEEYGADFVFITHYPSRKRPFYAMDDPEDPAATLSFDLLFRGMEITTGGQRIHDYHMLMEKIKARGMETEGMDQYLNTFRFGMPPHGGLGIGLERLTMQLLGEENVRETTLFPRDLNRLEP